MTYLQSNTIIPGDIFTIKFLPEETKNDYSMLRFPSCYGNFLTKFNPEENARYTLCKDNSVVNVDNMDESIGWHFIQQNNKFYYRVMQANFYPVEIEVKIIDKMEPIDFNDNIVASGVLHIGHPEHPLLN